MIEKENAKLPKDITTLKTRTNEFYMNNIIKLVITEHMGCFSDFNDFEYTFNVLLNIYLF